MEPLHIQKLLRDGFSRGHNCVEGVLKENSDLCINATRGKRYPNLVSLKYAKVGAPKGHPVVRECRGIILDEKDDFRVVARPFDRFFNSFEGYADTIDWDTARVQRKEDGTLAIVYFYRGEWHVATSGTADAGGPVGGLGITFADLFWKTFDGMHQFSSAYPQRSHVLRSMYPQFTYLFELMTPFNRVVVPHTQSTLTLLGVRETETGRWRHASALKFGNIPVVKEYPLRSLDECVATFEHLPGVHNEGYVVVDGNWNRIKVKHPGYMEAHNAKDTKGSSVRSLLELVRIDDHEEFVGVFPEYKPTVDEIVERYEGLVRELEETYARTKDIADQKEFAAAILKQRCNSALFRLRAKGTPIRETIADMPVQRLMEMLGLKDLVLMQHFGGEA